MTLPKHLRCIVNGQLVPGEVWSTSFAINYGDGNIDDVDELSDVAAAAIVLLTDGIFQTTNICSDQTTITDAVCRSYDEDGVLQAQGVAVPESSVVGPSALRLPPQCATVLSLQTIRPGGRGRGRMYLPLLSLGLTTGGRIPTATVTSVMDSLDDAFDEFETTIRGLDDMASANVAVASGVGSGLLTDVSAIRMGDVVDTQRRRRDELGEVYQVREI